MLEHFTCANFRAPKTLCARVGARECDRAPLMTWTEPESSKYFDFSLFSEIDTLLKECKKRDFTPFSGGDFNARIGNINMISPWNYEENCDTTTNKHGRIYFTDLCRRNKVYPLNHLISSDKIYHGDFTYLKANKKSQIDFIITNSTGRHVVNSFEIANDNWHISDHRPVSATIKMNYVIPSEALLVRAQDLNLETYDTSSKVERFNKNYNYQLMEEKLIEIKDDIHNDIGNSIERNDIKEAIEKLDNYLRDLHKESVTVPPKRTSNIDNNTIENINQKFIEYSNALKNGNETDIQQSLSNYLECRKSLTSKVLESEHKRWNTVVGSKDLKQLLKLIRWGS